MSVFKTGQHVAIARVSDDVAIAMTKVEALNKSSVRVTDGVPPEVWSRVWGLDGSEGSVRHKGRAHTFEANDHQRYRLRAVREGDAETAEHYEIARRLGLMEATAWRVLPLATLRQVAVLLGVEVPPVAADAPAPQPPQTSLPFTGAAPKDT